MYIQNYIWLSESDLKKSKLGDQVLQLVNTHRRVKTLLQFLKEVNGGNYLLQFMDKSMINLVGILRYYPMTAKYQIMNHIPKKYSRYLAVSSVIVSNKYRGKGYGKKLMNKLRTIKKPLYLDTYISWIPAVRLYLSVGFRIINSYSVGSDAVVQFVK